MANTISTSKSLLGGLRQYTREFDGIEDGGKSRTNLNKAWQDWNNNFETCMELEEISKNKWLQIMQILRDQQLWETIETFSDDNKSYNECKSKLEEYKRVINATWHEFFNKTPVIDETTRQHVERCKEIAKETEFEKFYMQNAILFNLYHYTPQDKVCSKILLNPATAEDTKLQMFK